MPLALPAILGITNPASDLSKAWTTFDARQMVSSFTVNAILLSDVFRILSLVLALVDAKKTAVGAIGNREPYCPTFLSRPCRPSDTPSSISSFAQILRPVRTAKPGSAPDGSVSKSAKVVLDAPDLGLALVRTVNSRSALRGVREPIGATRSKAVNQTSSDFGIPNRVGLNRPAIARYSWATLA